MSINFYRYGTDVVAVETTMPGAGSMRVGVGSSQVAAIDNLEATPIEGHREDRLGLEWLLGQMQDSVTDFDDLESLDDETKDDVEDWETVASYVATYPSDDGFGAVDVEVQVGRSGGGWYIRTTDDGGGSDDCDDTAYDTRDAAVAAADEFASSNNEADTGEDAEDYLLRQLEEAAGEPCADGEFAVYWASACAEDEGVRARYGTQESAAAACEIANKQIKQSHPGGNLLCGFEVRRAEGDDWIAVD